MGRPDILLRLDQLSRRYNTDPMTVLGWSVERYALAAMCADQAMATFAAMSKDSGAGMPVFVTGAL